MHAHETLEVNKTCLGKAKNCKVLAAPSSAIREAVNACRGGPGRAD